MPGTKSPSRPPHDAEDALAESETGELYRRHAAWLRTRLRRRLGPGAAADAEDLVQETYVRALLVERSRRIDNPRALLLKIAERLAIDLGRHAARFTATSANVAVHPSAPEQESGLLLKQVLLGLPPRLRDVFLLSRVAGLSYEQIAGELGLSVKTVEARMSKALALCAARLRD